MEDQFVMKRWALVALAVVAAVAIGTLAYQAGVSRGIALQPLPVAAAPAVPGAETAPSPYYRYRDYGPWHSGFFGFVPVLSILFFVFVLRTLMWGLFGWGWRHRSRWYYDDPGYGPSRFDDWHRRAHDRMRDDRATAQPPA